MKVQFASIQEGWAYELGGLWRTSDGGVSWSRRDLPVARLGIYDRQMLFRAYLTSSRRGWVQINQDLFRTEDAGLTWKEQALPRIKTEGWLLDGWYFLADGANGWILLQRPQESSDQQQSPGTNGDVRVYRTQNGGRTWLSGQSAAPSTSMGSLVPSQVYFRGALRGFLFDESLRVTSDGGRTWKTAVVSRNCAGAPANPPKADFVDIQFFDDQLGWALADDGTLLCTSDGGAGWCELQASQNIWTRGRNECPVCMNYTLHFWTQQIGSLIRGPGGPGFQSTFVTADGGEHWSADPRVWYPQAAFCLGNETCWFVTFNRELYRTRVPAGR